MLLCNRKPSIGTRLLMLAIFSATLFSFSTKTGGDHFEVYLGNKLIIQQIVTRDAAVKTLELTERNANEILRIHYNHCGKTGTSRSISIKTDDGKIVKTWHYPDAAGASAFMTCSVKEILSLQKNNGTKLNLFYSSLEIPKGKLLAFVSELNADKASLN